MKNSLKNLGIGACLTLFGLTACTNTHKMGMEATDEVTEALPSLDLNATGEEQLAASADGLPGLTHEQLEGLLALQQDPPTHFDEAQQQAWQQSMQALYDTLKEIKGKTKSIDATINIQTAKEEPRSLAAATIYLLNPYRWCVIERHEEDNDLCTTLVLILNALSQAGLDVNQEKVLWCRIPLSLLEWAEFWDNLEAFEWLLDHGADASTVSTALVIETIARTRGVKADWQQALLRKAIAAGLNPTFYSDQGTCFHSFVHNPLIDSHQDFIHIVLKMPEFQACHHRENAAGLTPWEDALSINQIESAKLLLEAVIHSEYLEKPPIKIQGVASKAQLMRAQFMRCFAAYGDQEGGLEKRTITRQGEASKSQFMRILEYRDQEGGNEAIQQLIKDNDQRLNEIICNAIQSSRDINAARAQRRPA